MPFGQRQNPQAAEQLLGGPDHAAQRMPFAHRQVAASVPLAAFVSSDGLTSNPDNIHFNAASLREFGRRYAAAFSVLEKKASAANRRAVVMMRWFAPRRKDQVHTP